MEGDCGRLGELVRFKGHMVLHNLVQLLASAQHQEGEIVKEGNVTFWRT